MIKIEEIKLPDLKVTPQIDFGKDFEAFDTERKIRYLKIFSSAMNHTADMIQAERNTALAQIETMKTILENADQAVGIQKDIVVRAITAHNAEKQELIARIQELESEAKNLNSIIDTLQEE